MASDEGLGYKYWTNMADLLLLVAVTLKESLFLLRLSQTSSGQVFLSDLSDEGNIRNII